MTFAEIYARVSAAVRSAFGHKTTRRELTPEEQRAIADKWLALMLKSYVWRAAGERYAGKRWEPRTKTPDDDGHLLLIKTGQLYNAVKNSTVTVYRGKKGVLEFHAEVENKPYKGGKKRKGKRAMTGEVFLCHQHGTPKMPARPIFVKLSPKDQKELDDFIEGFLNGKR